MRVLVTPDYRELSRQAAGIIADAVQARPDLVLGLPTGGTPLGMYEELVRRHRDEGLDFSRVRTFNLDEYSGLGAHHPKSYHAYMHAYFFDHVNVARESVHIPNAVPGYEEAIRKEGGIDLLIVGIGINGHIAFNEPGSSFKSRTREVELLPETRLSARKHFENASDVPQRAVTVGIATILEARRIVLIATGSAKADAVRRALKEPPAEAVPASALQFHSDVTVILDEAAAPDLFR